MDGEPGKRGVILERMASLGRSPLLTLSKIAGPAVSSILTNEFSEGKRELGQRSSVLDALPAPPEWCGRWVRFSRSLSSSLGGDSACTRDPGFVSTNLIDAAFSAAGQHALIALGSFVGFWISGTASLGSFVGFCSCRTSCLGSFRRFRVRSTAGAGFVSSISRSSSSVPHPTSAPSSACFAHPERRQVYPAFLSIETSEGSGWHRSRKFRKCNRPSRTTNDADRRRAVDRFTADTLSVPPHPRHRPRAHVSSGGDRSRGLRRLGSTRSRPRGPAPVRSATTMT
jgi:hypothetical protein